MCQSTGLIASKRHRNVIFKIQAWHIGAVTGPDKVAELSRLQSTVQMPPEPDMLSRYASKQAGAEPERRKEPEDNAVAANELFKAAIDSVKRCLLHISILWHTSRNSPSFLHI